MKKSLLIIFIVFLSYISAWSGNLEKTKQLAAQGDPHAQYFLGSYYLTGNDVEQDIKKAAYWFTKAAEQGIPGAQFNLGQMYNFGQGVAQDHKQAAYWYTKAAAQGDTKAQTIVGLIYYRAEGVAQDYKQAAYWFRKAAEQGEVNCQFYLGAMYDAGYGVRKDYKQAAYWFTKAAYKGHYSAQFSLGSMYYEGQGVLQNYKLAYAWSNLAAAQGVKSAESIRDVAAGKLTTHQLSEAQELAAKIQYQIDNDKPSGLHSQQPSMEKTEKTISGSGTGFVITKDGFILTCNHVIQDAAYVKINVDGQTLPAKIIRHDPHNDLALLKIEGSFSAIPFSPHRSAKIGQQVFTIGYPNPAIQGVSSKFTDGTISSLTGFQDDLRLYQVSVPVQPGNSGGALVDEYGNVIGIIVAMLDAKTVFKISGSVPQNVNYAIKSVYAQAMLDTFPEILGKLMPPSNNKANVIERVKSSTVMVLSYN